MAYGSVLTDTVQSSTAATAPTFKDGNGTQIGTLCRAWVNFNGTGTVAIRASFNVSSITDNGTGDYTVNFTTAMPDANYSVVAPCVSVSTAALIQSYPFTIAGGSVTQSAPTVNGFRMATQGSSGTPSDPQYVLASVFR